MRVEAAFELEESSEKLEAPWESSDSEVRYFDLREDPRAIEKIASARQYPPLKGFLAAVNSADSLFTTLRCHTALSERPETQPPAWEFTSRVDIVFAHEPFNFERNHYEALTQRLRELLSRDSGADTLSARLLVRVCHYRSLGRWGFGLTLVFTARAETPQAATTRWGLGLAPVQQALLYTSRVLRQQIAQVS